MSYAHPEKLLYGTDFFQTSILISPVVGSKDSDHMGFPL